MRAVVLGAAIAAVASFAFAAPPPYVIDPLFAAPIDRALENIEQSEMPEDRREALLARLNLLAWSRDDAIFLLSPLGSARLRMARRAVSAGASVLSDAKRADRAGRSLRDGYRQHRILGRRLNATRNAGRGKRSRARAT